MEVGKTWIPSVLKEFNEAVYSILRRCKQLLKRVLLSDGFKTNI
jgi:hypothetical protein